MTGCDNFGKDTDAEEITGEIEEFLKHGTRRDQAKNGRDGVLTFTDPAEFGIIEFEPEAATKGFYRKVNSVIEQDKSSQMEVQ